MLGCLSKEIVKLFTVLKLEKMHCGDTSVMALKASPDSEQTAAKMRLLERYNSTDNFGRRI